MKRTNNNYMILTTIFVVSIVIANVVGARVVTTGIALGNILLATSGGALTYAFTFLCTDVAGEIWGKEEARRMVKYGFIGQIFSTVMIIATGLLPAIDPAIDGAYNTLLGTNWLFCLGSLTGYLCSQTWDVYFFHKIRDAYYKKHGTIKGGKWLWNNGSTVTSQIIDTVAYAVISFGIGLGYLWTAEGRTALFGLIVGQYLLKFCLAIIDTPFFYLLTRGSSYDNKTEDKHINMKPGYRGIA